MWNGTKRKREIVEFLQLIDGGQNGIPSRLLVLRAGVGNGLIANAVDLSSDTIHTSRQEYRLEQFARKKKG